MAPRKKTKTVTTSPRARRSTRATKGAIQNPASLRLSSSTSISTSRSLRPRKPSIQPIPPKRKAPKPLPSYLQLNPTSPSTQTRPFFEALPAELLRQIHSILEPPSRICLTLTSKRLLLLLGKSCWSLCRPKKQAWISQFEYAKQQQIKTDQEILLSYLSRDSNDLKYCQTCEILHPPLSPPQTHRITKYTQRCFGVNGAVDYLPFCHASKTGYSLVWDHIRHVFESDEFASLPSFEAIPYLSGEFSRSLQHPELEYTLATSATKISGNLVIRHEHKFAGNLLPLEVFRLPFRICPHQSTATGPPDDNPILRRNWSKGKKDLNGAFFMHTILGAFPGELIGTQLAKKHLKEHEWKKMSPLDEKDIKLINSGKSGSVSFWCRFCPTKWTVNASDDGREFKVTAWHCFYGDIVSAAKVWPWFVRREAYNLGKKTRNSEYWSQGRTIREFQIE
ncbi:hypothetical protein QBC43DRAFT_310206 [Cladorrhinum sp. PSN259]|nr:hypothetical protein QBC43DRAFT_310206 [Cladorrhinum sp. PSN259]